MKRKCLMGITSIIFQNAKFKDAILTVDKSFNLLKKKILIFKIAQIMS